MGAVQYIPMMGGMMGGAPMMMPMGGLGSSMSSLAQPPQ